MRPHLNADLATDGRRPRVIHREPVTEGFSVETGVLSSTQNIQVNFRPPGWYRRDEWFGRNRDSALGMWSLSVPEMIGTSDGFVFGFEVPERWQPAGGGDAVEYVAESHPLGPDFDRACFAGPDHLIDRDGLVRYRAEIAVGFDLVEIALHSDAVSRAVGPGATAVQRTYLAAFALPLDEALAELDSRIARGAAAA